MPRPEPCAPLLASLVLLGATGCQPAPPGPATDALPVAPVITELAELRPVIDATGFAGAVVVYNTRSDEYVGVYADDARRGRLPASTFKIMNALIAIELGLVDSAATVLAWDGVPHERTELNRDLTLADAFRISAVPHFQQLARQAGAERMQYWLDEVGYGNRDLGGGIDEFWLDGDLRVSPLEQVLFLDGLRRGTLPFRARAHDVVRQIMVVEHAASHTLRAKTGWTRGDWGSTGWWVGWVERGDDAWVFATVLDSTDPRADFGGHRQDATRAVLRELDALPTADSMSST